MPADAYLQVRISQEEKAEAQAVLQQMGLSLSGGVKMFLRQVVHTKKLPFRPESEPILSPKPTVKAKKSPPPSIQVVNFQSRSKL